MKNKIVMLCLVCFIVCSHIWKDNNIAIKAHFKKNILDGVKMASIIYTTNWVGFGIKANLLSSK